MRIKFDFDSSDRLWCSPMDTPQFWAALQNHGIYVVDRNQDIFLQDFRLGPSVHPNTVIFDRSDTTSLTAHAASQANTNTIGFLVPMLSSSASVNISPGYTDLPVVALNTLLWDQLSVHGFYKDPIPRKDIDVLFAGTVHYGSSVLSDPREHRRPLIKNWHQLMDMNSVAVFGGAPRLLTWNHAWEVTKRSKVVVSPWGVSEISWRDYEAVLGECMIVKPRQPFIDATWNPWRENTVFCEPDFSDLEVAVRKALDTSASVDLSSLRQEAITDGYDITVLARIFSEKMKSLVLSSPNVARRC